MNFFHFLVSRKAGSKYSRRLFKKRYSAFTQTNLSHQIKFEGDIKFGQLHSIIFKLSNPFLLSILLFQPDQMIHMAIL
jgi:hypothetical protein